MSRLDASPVTVEVTGTVTAIQLGHPTTVVVDGAALLRWLRADIGGAGGSRAAEVPEAANGVLAGTLDAAGGPVTSLETNVGDCLGLLAVCERPNFGALYSIVCRDLAGRIDESRLEASVDGRPAYADLFAPSPLLVPCDAWSVPPAGPDPDGPITGGVPTLMMRGSLDPFSAPLPEVATAVGALDNVFEVEVPNQSYNVLGFTECPRAIRNAWIDAPTPRQLTRAASRRSRRSTFHPDDASADGYASG